jgi:hypothetical protein
MEKRGARVSEMQQRPGHSSLAITSTYLASLASPNAGDNPYANAVEADLGILA